MLLWKGRTAARPNSRAPPFTYPRVRSLGYLQISGARSFCLLLAPACRESHLCTVGARLLQSLAG